MNVVFEEADAAPPAAAARRVDDQHAPHARQPAVGGRRARAAPEAEHRARRVEEVREQHRQHDGHREPRSRAPRRSATRSSPTRLKSGAATILSGNVADPVGPDRLVLGLVDDRREQRRAEDPDQQRAADVPGDQRVGPEQPDDEDRDRPGVELRGDRDDGARALDDDPGVDEPDDRDEQADPDPDRELEVVRDGVDDRLAEADEHERGDDQALDDDDAHRVRPAELVGARRARRPRRR